MSEDGEKDQGKGAERPSRPVTASARRERRASARAAGEQGNKGKAANPSAKGKAETAPAGRKDTATPKRDRAAEKVPLPKRLVRFVREVLAELGKVIWPTRKQMVTYTIVVLVFVAFMIGLVALLDLVFAKAVFALFG